MKDVHTGLVSDSKPGKEDLARDLASYKATMGSMSPLERALRLAYFYGHFNWKNTAAISKAIGQTEVWITNHWALLELCEEVLKKLDEGHIQIEAAVYLARFRHRLQAQLVDAMPQTLQNSKHQIDWIRKALGVFGAVDQAKPQRTARKLRLLVQGHIRPASAAPGVRAASAEYFSSFPNSRAEPDAGSLSAKLQVEPRADKMVVQSPPAKLEPKRAASIPPADQGRIDFTHARAPTAAQRQPAVSAVSLDSAVQSIPNVLAPGEKGIDYQYIHPTTQRMVMGSMSRAFFVERGRKGMLKYQVEGKEKPDYLPNWEDL